jgi:hypothetical protein
VGKQGDVCKHTRVWLHAGECRWGNYDIIRNDPGGRNPVGHGCPHDIRHCHPVISCKQSKQGYHRESMMMRLGWEITYSQDSYELLHYVVRQSRSPPWFRPCHLRRRCGSMLRHFHKINLGMMVSWQVSDWINYAVMITQPIDGYFRNWLWSHCLHSFEQATRRRMRDWANYL